MIDWPRRRIAPPARLFSRIFRAFGLVARSAARVWTDFRAGQPDTSDDGVPDGGVSDDGVPDDQASDDGVPDDQVSDDHVPAGGVSEDGVSDSGVSDDQVPAGGVSEDGVPAGGVPDDGVSDDGVPDGGVSDDQVPAGGVSDDQVPDDGVPAGGVSDDQVPDDQGVPDDQVSDDQVPAGGVSEDGVSAGGVSDDQVLAGGVSDDQVPDDQVPDDGVPAGGVSAGGVPDDGVPDDGVPDDGVPDDQVSDDGVPNDGVSDDGVSAGGVSDGGVPDGGVPDDGVSDDLKPILEALIFASPEPLTPAAMVDLIEGTPKEDVERALAALQAEYEQRGGLQMVHVAGGYQICTRPELHEWVRRLFHQHSKQRLSVQALETLAVIAYKQPITSAEIAEIRGVNVSGVVGTLLERQLVKVIGRKRVVGRPFLYATTQEFLNQFGLSDLDDLPKVEEMAEALGMEVPAALAAGGPEAPPLTFDGPEAASPGPNAPPPGRVH